MLVYCNDFSLVLNKELKQMWKLKSLLMMRSTAPSLLEREVEGEAYE